MIKKEENMAIALLLLTLWWQNANCLLPEVFRLSHLLSFAYRRGRLQRCRKIYYSNSWTCAINPPTQHHTSIIQGSHKYHTGITRAVLKQDSGPQDPDSKFVLGILSPIKGYIYCTQLLENFAWFRGVGWLFVWDTWLTGLICLDYFPECLDQIPMRTIKENLICLSIKNMIKYVPGCESDSFEV